MKILYALQCTGNGHIARAQEILPVLEKYGEVDLLISGHQSQISLPKEPKYVFKGISLLYNVHGGLSYWKTLLGNDFMTALKNIKQFSLDEYDLVLNDFEPISAWACKLKKIKSISLSHQAAMLFPETPKPEHKNWIGELVLKHYAPTTYKIGFHFEKYDPNIFHPVIRSRIRNLNPTDSGHYLVYLPSFSDEIIAKELGQIPVSWKVFSKHSKSKSVHKNVEISPVDEKDYLKEFESCRGVLCNAGFEMSAEALYLKKKLFVIPIKNQYEQLCNCIAIEKLGVSSSNGFDLEKIQQWVSSDARVEVEYKDEIEEIIQKVIGLQL